MCLVLSIRVDSSSDINGGEEGACVTVVPTSHRNHDPFACVCHAVHRTTLISLPKKKKEEEKKKTIRSTRITSFFMSVMKLQQL
jgi:hypothetical protein